ncbi:GntR family transcriptional regulator [Enemella evansiae]|uniref:GntR family transcriptional regulator n=1 Tax=Enemella evansiae TaxID=2016499 RepID=UPI000B97C9D8|nr:GntR family transcriptional regulator [Enemella evansiae]OYO04966.1 GntR family transcriptional regulator [Enemella evansiae]
MDWGERRVGETAYQHLARELRDRILDNAFPPDEPLPTETALAQQFGLSRQTVRRAFLELVNEGLVTRRAGRGTFACPPGRRYQRHFGSIADLIGLSADSQLEVVTPLAGGYDPQAAERLKVSERLLYTVTFRRWHEGECFCATTVWLPPKQGAALERVPALSTPGARVDRTIIGLLEEHGFALRDAEQRITAALATEQARALLDCHSGDPVLHIERTYTDHTDTPMEYAVSDYLPSHYTHVLHLGRA